MWVKVVLKGEKAVKKYNVENTLVFFFAIYDFMITISCLCNVTKRNNYAKKVRKKTFLLVLGY